MTLPRQAARASRAGHPDRHRAGAAGYVLKQVRGSDLADAVRAATTGQPLLHPRAAAEETAKNYVSTLFRKLGLKQRTAQPPTPVPTAGCRPNRPRT